MKNENVGGGIHQNKYGKYSLPTDTLGPTSAYCFSALSSPEAIYAMRLFACSTATILEDFIRYSVDNLLPSGTCKKIEEF